MSLLHSHLLTLLVQERGSVAPCYWEPVCEGKGEREGGREGEKEMIYGSKYMLYIIFD